MTALHDLRSPEPPNILGRALGTTGKFWAAFSDWFLMIVVEFGLSTVSAGGSVFCVWNLGPVSLD